MRKNALKGVGSLHVISNSRGVYAQMHHLHNVCTEMVMANLSSHKEQGGCVQKEALSVNVFYEGRAYLSVNSWLES